MKGKQAEALLMKIEEAIGLTKYDFIDGRPIYTRWGADENGDYNESMVIDLTNLKHRSLKISKNLGDVYIDSIHTDEYVVVGKGTTLWCEDLQAGKGVVTNFDGFLL